MNYDDARALLLLCAGSGNGKATALFSVETIVKAIDAGRYVIPQDGSRATTTVIRLVGLVMEAHL